MQTVCDHEGCEKGIATGHALQRVSRKGTPFVGMCSEHYAGTPDPVAAVFEEANLHGRGASPSSGLPKETP